MPDLLAPEHPGLTHTQPNGTRPALPASVVDPDREFAELRPLAEKFPDVDSAMSEIAWLSAVLTLPKGAIHVISDVHGEDKKLRHIINNASGTLRPLVEKLFRDRLDPKAFQELLTLLFYPAEVTERLSKTLTDPQDQRAYAERMLPDMFEVVRALASRYSLRQATSMFPVQYRELLMEILLAPTGRKREFLAVVIDQLVQHGRVLQLIHLTGRLVRNLAIRELIIAGDCFDRGPRGDRVVDYLRDQPHVSFIWGNHDAAWLGAALGHEALICHILRISLRYRALRQIDEGYSIPLTPLEYLARTVYGSDPATVFMPKRTGLREKVTVARMQKAAAIMQFKLEGQMLARHPEWELSHRRLLHRIDLKAKTVEIDGKLYALRDANLPTINPEDPYTLSPEERQCIDCLRESVMSSLRLAEHMKFLVRHGRMYLRRDDNLIFHGCLPVSSQGEFLPMSIHGEPYRGKALMDRLEQVIFDAFEHRNPADLDLLWYLWSGPRSPLFGKDRITTFERDFVADEDAYHETKDPYFSLIHEPWFCDRVLEEFGADPSRGLIVNGHVPVKIEKGESPLKRSGKAITIDGAFSEAYGDHGYTLVLDADRTCVAKHHHFESIEVALRDGVDIVPSVTEVRTWNPPRRVGDTERGTLIRHQIEMLERLVDAYRHNRLRRA